MDVTETSPCHMALLGGTSYYVAGQRIITGACKSPFVWRPEANARIPMLYAQWGAGQPDCALFYPSPYESCLHYWSDNGYRFNDVTCEWSGCSICQYTGVVHIYKSFVILNVISVDIHLLYVLPWHLLFNITLLLYCYLYWCCQLIVKK